MSNEQVMIRRAVRADIPHIARINSLVFSGNRDNVEAATKWVRSWFRSYPLYQYFVAEIGEKVVGYIGWQIHGGFIRAAPVVELEQVGVDPKFQRKKIGPKLGETIREVVKWIQKNNTRIEGHIYVVVWGWTLNFPAMKVYAESFGQGIDGFRNMYAGRPESMFRWFIPVIRPIRKGKK